MLFLSETTEAPLQVELPASTVEASEPFSVEQTYKEEMQFIIRYVSREHGVDEDIMLAIAWAESRYDCSAKNPVSTAEGCFQILDGTWEYFNCRGSKLDPYDNSVCAMKIYHDGLHHWDESRHVWLARL